MWKWLLYFLSLNRKHDFNWLACKSFLIMIFQILLYDTLGPSWQLLSKLRITGLFDSGWRRCHRWVVRWLWRELRLLMVSMDNDYDERELSWVLAMLEDDNFFLMAGGWWLVEAKRSEEIRLWDFKEKRMVSSLFSM